MSPEILGKPGVLDTDHDADMDSLLGQTVFSTNADLDEKSQLSPRVHRILRDLSGDKAPTNKDALDLYTRAFGKVTLNSGSGPKGIGPKGFEQLQAYLNAAGILVAPMSYAETRV